MKKNGGGADNSFGPPLGERAVWDTDSPDHECDCPGPPPQFYLPPPPRPSSLVDSDCSENSVSHLETCEAVPVIDAEYHYSPAIPSLAIILTVAVVLVVFLLIGTFLVVLKVKTANFADGPDRKGCFKRSGSWKQQFTYLAEPSEVPPPLDDQITQKRKMRNLFSRKPSPHNRCDTASANGVIYEDLTNVRSRTLSSHCPPGQTTLPSIEMIDVVSYPDHAMFTPVFICPTSPLQDSYNSQELFNPVYEELSNGSGERGETDSEGMPQVAISEDEFAEDELSLGGEADVRPGEREKQDGNDVCRDLDSSDADDRSKFLENYRRNSSLPSDYRDKWKRVNRGSHSRAAAKRPKSLDRKKIWRSKAPPPLPGPPVDCNEFHEGFLLKKILQIYPDVTGVGLQYSRGSPSVQPHSENHLPDDSGSRYESLAILNHSHPRQPKREIFSTFGAMQSSAKNQSQDSSLGSDSGYSNNTSGGKSSLRARKEYGMPNHSHLVLS